VNVAERLFHRWQAGKAPRAGAAASLQRQHGTSVRGRGFVFMQAATNLSNAKDNIAEFTVQLMLTSFNILLESLWSEALRLQQYT